MREKKNVLARVGGGLVTAGACLLVVGTLGSALYLHVGNEVAKSQKTLSQITSDASSVNADLGVAYNLAGQLHSKTPYRLKMSEDSPIVVQCKENLDQKEIAMIEAIVEYYNWIFSTINRNYSFEVKKENEEIPADATIVSFENDALESRVHGRMNPVVFSGGSGNNFINSARIVVDWEKIKTEEDAYIYYVLFHEFTHVLGLGDVYYQGDFKNTQRVELETIMNLENSRRGMNCLYPNDYAVLQALYSNEYNLTKNYEEAVNKVKGKIEEYTKIFYKKYGRYLKEKCGATSKMCEKDVGSKIKWVRENGGKTKWYEIELKKDGKCVFAIKDREGNKLETSEAEYIFVDNVLHIRGIMLENANNYDEYSFSKDLKMKLLLSIYKDEFGELWAYDGMQYWTGVSMTTQINIKTK